MGGKMIEAEIANTATNKITTDTNLYQLTTTTIIDLQGCQKHNKKK
jgi:hypothetical protein